MGKVNDRFTARNMREGAVINARDLVGASVIQQLGLDKPEGMQRMLSILLFKMDPESKGVVLTLADLQAYGEAAVRGRANILTYGMYDSILFKLCTDEEMRDREAVAEAAFKKAGVQ